MIERNFSPTNYTLTDLCKKKQLLECNLRNLSLSDSRSVLKMLRGEVNWISQQLNEDRENPGIYKDADWSRKARVSRSIKQQMIVLVNAHIKYITQASTPDEPINRDQLTIENTRLKKKLARRELRVSYLENERRILFDYLRSRCSEEFILELYAEVDREAEKYSTGSID